MGQEQSKNKMEIPPDREMLLLLLSKPQCYMIRRMIKEMDRIRNPGRKKESEIHFRVFTKDGLHTLHIPSGTEHNLRGTMHAHFQ